MITAENLAKSYSGVRVVSDVSFTCTPGTITGFLGPNGAGKSTTLRMITGLTGPDAGRSTVAGHAYRDIDNPLTTVGTLLDASAMHPGRTGRDTVVDAALMAGVPTARADDVLATVGLSEKAARRRVGTYSLGMRQRLGLALALIGDPQVLILDEPANGLDPEGIAWMRHLLREFADRGGTVLLSSHLLGEVRATVDHLVVISGGGRRRVRAAGVACCPPVGWPYVRPTPQDLVDALARDGISCTPGRRRHLRGRRRDRAGRPVDAERVATVGPARRPAHHRTASGRERPGGPVLLPDPAPEPRPPPRPDRDLRQRNSA